MQKNQNFANETLYGAGQKFYLTYCAACHGADKKGIETNPSLVGIHDRFKESEILDKLRTGSAIMPSITGLIKGKEDQILAFLTETGQDVPVQISDFEISTFSWMHLQKIVLDDLAIYVSLGWLPV